MGLPSAVLHAILPIVYWSRLLRHLGLLIPVLYMALMPGREVSTAAVLASIRIHHHSRLGPIHYWVLRRHIFGQVKAYGHDACEDENGAEVVEERLSDRAGLGLFPVEVQTVGCHEADFYYRAEEERKGDKCYQEYSHLGMSLAEVSGIVEGEISYQLLLVILLFHRAHKSPPCQC